MKRQALTIIIISLMVMLISTTSTSAKNFIIGTDSQFPADFETSVTAVNGTVVSLHAGSSFAVVSFDNDEDAFSLESLGLDVMPDVELQFLSPISEFHQESSQQRISGWWELQWHLNVLQVFDAWGTGATGEGVRVAVIDSGLDYNHVYWIGGNIDMASSATFVPDTVDCMDTDGHGTHVAGIIACPGLLSQSTIGIAPQATIIPIKVIGDGGSGSASWILNGIIHAVNVDADIINLSLGGYLDLKGNPPHYTKKDARLIRKTYRRIINWAFRQGAFLITSAGNEGLNMDEMGSIITTPGECGNIVNISATGPINQVDFDRIASYSNYGKSLIFLAAPGGDSLGSIYDYIISTSANNQIGFYVGTSQAAPMVAGVAALVLQKYGPMRPRKLEKHLKKTADDLGDKGKDEYYGYGLVNAYKAVTK